MKKGIEMVQMFLELESKGVHVLVTKDGEEALNKMMDAVFANPEFENMEVAK